MKNKIFRIALVTLLFVVVGTSSAPVFADTMPAPLCYPKPCSGK